MKFNFTLRRIIQRTVTLVILLAGKMNLSSLNADDSSDREYLKIICINVLEGIHEENRYQLLTNFINQQDPDILGLLELNGWETNGYAKLKDFLSKTHFTDFIFTRANSDYNLALFSKRKLWLRESLPEGMGHGLIRVRIPVKNESVTLFFTHLTPGTEDARLAEMSQILSYVHRDELTLIMGDLNSLSPNDPYSNQELLENLRNANIQKFGTLILRKDVISRLLTSGFKDVAETTNTPFKPTVPTLMNKDKAHAAELRLDYFFINPPLLPRVIRYDVVKTVETDQLSDHYPILVELEF